VQQPQVVITGASRGLGRLIALACAREGAGLVLVARDSAALDAVRAACLSAGAREARIVSVDVAAPAAPAEIEAAIDRNAPFALVNNAAIQGPIGPAWETSQAEFEETVRVNFLAPVALCRMAVARMRVAGGGWIVNLSGGGATGPRPGFAAYGAAKTALVRFSENLAAEAGPHGVRVNAIAPGAFRSGMTEAVLGAPEHAGEKEVAVARRLASEGDDASAHKAAALVAYLVLGDGRDVTGKLISAVWDPWDTLHERARDLEGTDIYTLRRITPPERGKSWGG
jgi:NAD(P)-dependent dehydrogenase (short-subunit alcohol dehydrogenase family)